MKKPVIPGDAHVAVAYIRTSTEDQSLSPEAQRAAIDRWAQQFGVVIDSYHEDIDVCSETPAIARPGLVGALAAVVKSHAGVLIVAKRDRLARDVTIMAFVERECATLGSVVRSADGLSDAEGPTGALIKGILDLFAAYELAQIRSRTKAALAAKKAKGEPAGHAPFGMRVGEGGQLQPDESERAAIAFASEKRALGFSVRGIQQQMQWAGYATRRGKPYSVAAIHAMLKAG